jgi:hypothetical protein
VDERLDARGAGIRADLQGHRDRIGSARQIEAGARDSERLDDESAVIGDSPLGSGRTELETGKVLVLRATLSPIRCGSKPDLVITGDLYWS